MKTNNCIKFHKEMKFPGVSKFKLWTLGVDNSTGFCDVCFTNIISSFGGLKRLSIIPAVSDQQMKKIFETQIKLERLTVNCYNVGF